MGSLGNHLPTLKKRQDYSTFLEENGNIKKKEVKYFTVDDAIEKIGLGKFQVWITTIAGIWAISNTMGTYIVTLLGPLLQCDWGLSYVQNALITTAVFFGTAVAGPYFGFLGDHFDRKTSLLYSSGVSLYFGVLCGFAWNYLWLVFLRFITGVGLGGLPVMLAYYLEFFPTKARGKVMILCGLLIPLGAIMLALLAIIILPYFTWRVWLIVAALPFVLSSALFLIAPTSPRFNASTGNLSKATQTLKLMAQLNKTTLPEGILAQQNQQIHRGHIKSLFVPKLRKTTVLLWFAWFLIMINLYGSGMLTTELISYDTECVTTSTAYEGMMELPCRLGCYGLQTDDLLAIMMSSAAEFPAIILVAFIVDPLGRKNSMILVGLIGCLCCVLLLVCVNRSYIFGLLLLLRGSSVSSAIIIFLYTPEVYPTECRSMGSGCSSAIGRIGAMVMPFVAQVLLAYSPPVGVSVFAVLNLLFAVTCYCLPYETSGKRMA